MIDAKGDLSEGFHIYSLLWESNKLTFYIDRISNYSAQLPASWTNSFAYILLGGMTVGGTDTWASPADSSTPSPAFTYYDWIRVLGNSETPFVCRMDGRAGFLG
jgi:beta-glucanase (GH16 family)